MFLKFFWGTVTVFWVKFCPVPHYSPNVILGNFLGNIREHLGCMTCRLLITDELLQSDLLRCHSVPTHVY